MVPPKRMKRAAPDQDHPHYTLKEELMKYIKTTIKVQIKDDGTPIDEVVGFVQSQALAVTAVVQDHLDVGATHAWTTRHQQVTG